MSSKEVNAVNAQNSLNSFKPFCTSLSHPFSFSPYLLLLRKFPQNIENERMYRKYDFLGVYHVYPVIQYLCTHNNRGVD